MRGLSARFRHESRFCACSGNHARLLQRIESAVNGTGVARVTRKVVVTKLSHERRGRVVDRRAA
jgi:hypothetical protein